MAKKDKKEISDEIKEEKRRVIQEIAHDDINSENLT